MNCILFESLYETNIIHLASDKQFNINEIYRVGSFATPQIKGAQVDPVLELLLVYSFMCFLQFLGLCLGNLKNAGRLIGFVKLPGDVNDCVNDCVHGPLRWTGLSSGLYFHVLLSVRGIVSRASMILTRIKHLLKKQ